MSNHTQIWSNLSLDIKAHGALPSIPGDTYKDIFLSEENLPEKMKHFGSAISEAGRLRAQGILPQIRVSEIRDCYGKPLSMSST